MCGLWKQRRVAHAKANHEQSHAPLSHAEVSRIQERDGCLKTRVQEIASDLVQRGTGLAIGPARGQQPSDILQ